MGVSMLVALKAVASGAAVGFVLGLIGGGGSILAVPLFLYFVGLRTDPHVAIGTTALAVGVNAMLAGIPHLRQQRVDLHWGLRYAAAGVLGTIAGSRAGLLVDGRRLLLLFAAVMVLVAVRMWQGAAAQSGKDVPGRSGAASGVRVAGAGLGTGFLSGFFGIGGGFLIVPGLMWAAGMDIRRAVGTSLISVAAFGLSTALQYAVAGKVDLLVAALYVLGGSVGGLIGPQIGQRMNRAALQRLFAVLVVVVALYMAADVLKLRL